MTPIQLDNQTETNAKYDSQGTMLRASPLSARFLSSLTSCRTRTVIVTWYSRIEAELNA